MRTIVAGKALWFYAWKLVWPSGLVFIYPRWDPAELHGWQWVFPGAAACVPLFCWSLRRRIGEGPLVAVCYFGGTLLPALGFVNVYPMRFSFVADHFQYLASIGPLALLGALLTLVGDRWRSPTSERSGPVRKRATNMGGLAVLGVLATLGVLTFCQAAIYANPEVLWRDALAQNPSAWIARNNLGLLLLQHGRVAEAIHHFQVGLATKPDYTPFHNNLGLAYARAGDTERAAEHFAKAIELQPHYPVAHDNLAASLARLGDPEAAVAAYRQAIRLSPDNPQTLHALAWLLAASRPSTEDGREAVRLARRAIALSEPTPSRLDTLAAALASAGDFEQAVSVARQAAAAAGSMGDHQLAGEIASRLDQYEQRQPFRESLRPDAELRGTGGRQ